MQASHPQPSPYRAHTQRQYFPALHDSGWVAGN